jgi:hypothetical protein
MTADTQQGWVFPFPKFFSIDVMIKAEVLPCVADWVQWGKKPNPGTPKKCQGTPVESLLSNRIESIRQ